MKLYRNLFRFNIMCRVQLRLLSGSELWSFDCVFMFFCKIYILVHAIELSEFSQDDVSDTIMNVPPF